jgi:hypothetical protein
MAKLPKDPLLNAAMWDITKFRYHVRRSGQSPREYVWTLEEFPDLQGKTGPPEYSQIWLRWWRENPKWTSDRFAKVYADWKLLTGQGKDKEAEEKYQGIKDLGIAALPYMMDRVKQGDRGLMPAISYLTDSVVPGDAQAAECLEWWEKNKEQWTIPFGPLPTEPSQAGEAKEGTGEQRGVTTAPPKPEG